MTNVTLKEEDYAKFTPEQVAEIAARLEEDDYNSPFDCLQDWHLLRAIAFHRQDLVEPYLYLLDIESYDES
jgi:uncharacterized protein (DUF849 family)